LIPCLSGLPACGWQAGYQTVLFSRHAELVSASDFIKFHPRPTMAGHPRQRGILFSSVFIYTIIKWVDAVYLRAGRN